ncbi:MAG: PTS sugar transporter subunit IIA [Candidatus Latescibacterota bacterium]|nr:MAG: PTS sugar transporter subunit IIA [Candidatus Latescibacterota bacterium]
MQGIAFGPTIRLLRQAKGISLREMARKLGVSPAFLSQIEAGRQHKIPKARIVQVASMLGVSEAYLLGTARQIHPDVVDFLKETPEAAEFLITAMKSGLVAEDFADLREALKDKAGKGFVRRAKLPATSRKKKRAKKDVADDLSSFLDPALCVTGLIVQNRDRLFRRISKLVTKRNKSLATETILEKLEHRERQAPTIVGGGVAIPHAFVSDIDQPIVGAMYLKRAVPFSPDGDGRVKTVFFLIGNEDKPQFHISILARIARLCSTPEFLDAFGGSRTNRELYKTILQWDKRVGSV